MSKEPKILKVAKPTHEHSNAIFRSRKPEYGFAWHEVDHALILAAFAGCLAGGHALMLSSAMGGRGVCIRIMKGRNVEPEVEYAGSGFELNDWLRAIADGYSSGSEDAVEAMRAGITAYSARSA